MHIAARFTTPRVLQSPRRPPEPRPLVPRARKMSAPPKVGFLGLGIMGAQMAARLVRSGAQVTVWNRSLAKTEPLKALGALVASTPREVTTSCDLVFAMLADPQAAMKVATEGPDAAVAGIAARPPTAAPITYVDCSTVDAATGEFVGNAVRAAMVAGAADPDKGGFLAAPVSGGWRDCRDGTLLFLCGGSRAAYDAACVPHGLDAMGHKRWLLGPNPGDAARAKLMLQVTAAPITYVDCSTVDAATGEFVGNAVRAAMVAGAADPDKGGFLAAPVSGGWRDCRDGTLLFLCGGSRAAYDAACVPHGLDAMGHKRWLLGPNPGDAARAKLMLQVMMGNMVGSLAEMMALSKASGLDERAVLDVLSNSAMGNPLCTAKGKLMMEMKYEPNFQVYLQQKDLRLALQLADDLGVPAPISAAANAQYVRARQMCLANADFAAVRMAYEAEVPPDKESETGELN